MFETETKSNSIEVALNVFDIPSAFSRSGSVPQLSSPSFRILILFEFPPEKAFPVVSIIPLSKGKLELAFSKYPKLEKPLICPFTDELMLVISTQPSAKLFSINC